jgi:hypothetical protein
MRTKLAAGGVARTSARVGAVLLFAILPVALLALFVVDVPHLTYAWDFHAFWHAAHEVVHGGDPYSFPGVNADGRPIPAYVYPPLLGELLAPLGLLPFVVAAIVFMAASAIALLVALWLLGVRDWRCYGMTFLWVPTLHGLRLGALTPFLVLGIALCWRLRHSSREVIPLAVIVILKLFLWPLLFWHGARNGMRALLQACAIAFVLAGASWAVVGFAGLREYPSLLRHAQDGWAAGGYGVATISHAAGISNGATNLLLLAATAAATAAIARSMRVGGVSDAGGLALFLVVALLFSPVMWLHYATLLVVPLALLRTSFGLAWFVPLALWVTPFEESRGESWRIAVALATV